MYPELHRFLTGQLWVKLKEDVTGLRVFNSTDLAHVAYFHIRRYLLIQPGWYCRSDSTNPHILTLAKDPAFQSVLYFVCLLKPGVSNFFPAELLDEKMRLLRQLCSSAADKVTRKAYLWGVFDTKEPWFFPSEPHPSYTNTADRENQACFWMPINCGDFPGYDEWRRKWEEQAEK